MKAHKLCLWTGVFVVCISALVANYLVLNHLPSLPAHLALLKVVPILPFFFLEHIHLAFTEGKWLPLSLLAFGGFLGGGLMFLGAISSDAHS